MEHAFEPTTLKTYLIESMRKERFFLFNQNVFGQQQKKNCREKEWKRMELSWEWHSRSKHIDVDDNLLAVRLNDPKKIGGF